MLTAIVWARCYLISVTNPSVWKDRQGRLPANFFQLCDLPLLSFSSRSHVVSAKLLRKALQRTASDPVLVLGTVQVIPAASDTMCFLSSRVSLGNSKCLAPAAVFVLWRKFPSQLMEEGRCQ